MIKPHCSVCGRFYIGNICACQRGGRYHELICECGSVAKEVYIDDLGEWALCENCLKEILDDDGDSMDEPTGQEAVGKLPVDDDSQIDGNPFGLTRRQLQIADLSNLRNGEIAEKLMISPHTVQAHMKTILRKLNVRSRREIRYVIQGVDNRKGLNETSELFSKNSILTVSITFTDTLQRIQEILSMIFKTS
ncbi:MAG: LuxR C-terminal-related transcriptional regulator [Chloroflexota bacterium]|nr:LuxR C-terminal-related transcriptional regulator [Chloroflexota bacterium]